MTTEDTAAFIDGYGPDSLERICFAWNQKHAAEFVDANDAFRQQVIAAVLSDPGKAGIDLIADLFEAEARWSNEAGCVRRWFSKLASLLLVRGGEEQLDRFIEWVGVSMNTYCQCHAMEIDPVTLARLISEVHRRRKKVANVRERAGLEMVRVLFAKLKSDNPMEGMLLFDPSQRGRARGGSKTALWFEKVLRLFRIK
ncbi:MAG: hypothetical protein KGQ60_00155 [Planctomycetes bacterium]|nr:hypothetical protein [Planctomycetota bacterium]